MVIKFERSFFKDLDKIREEKTASQLKEIIAKLEATSEITEISNLKKLKGHSSAFRIRVGDYRLGVFVSGNTIEVNRFLHRKEIYRYFP